MEIHTYKETEKEVVITAVLYVTRKTQVPIVVGTAGSGIKKIVDGATQVSVFVFQKARANRFMADCVTVFGRSLG